MEQITRSATCDVIVTDGGETFTLAVVRRSNGAFLLPPVKIPGDVRQALVEALQSDQKKQGVESKETDPPPTRKSTKKTAKKS